MNHNVEKQTAAEVLARCAEFFERNPSAWCQNSTAVDADGEPALPAKQYNSNRNRPVAWCALGIIAKDSHQNLPIMSTPHKLAARALAQAISPDVTEGTRNIVISQWNDSLTAEDGSEEVARHFRYAQEMMEAQA